MKQIFTALLFLVLTISTQGARCESATDTSAIKIGWIGPLSDKAAALGIDNIPAIQIAFDQVNASGGINGHKIQLIAEDDQYTTSKTLSAYHKLVHQDKVNVIYVLTYSGLFALAPKAERDNVLLLDPLDCDEDIAKLPQNTLCVAKLTEDLGRANADFAFKRQHTPSAIIYHDDDAFMITAAQETAKRLRELGADVKFVEGTAANNTDFKPRLLKAKSLKLGSLMLYGYDQMGLAMKQARELGLTVQFYALGTISSPDFLKLAGPSSENTYFPWWLATRSERFSWFSSEFHKRVGRDPILEISTVPAFDIANLIAEGLKAGALTAQASIDIPKLRNFFYGIKNHSGLSGNITIDPDGITRSLKVDMKVIKNGKIADVQG